MRIAAGKVGARRAVVRHEQRVADEDRIVDLVGDVGRRVPGRVENLDVEFADLEAFAVPEEMSKSLPSVFRSVALKTGRKMRCTSLICSPMPIFAPVLALM